MSEREQLPPATSSGATAHGATVPDATVPPYSSAGVAMRRPDAPASLVLLIAGIAAGLSLLLPWLADDDVTGLTLVKDGFRALRDGVAELIGTGYIQPVTIVLGGGLLFLFGLLLLVPARAHRLVGGISLVVALLVTAAVLVPLVAAGWALGYFGIGFWFASAVAVLGLVGGLKALLTRPKRA
jgi:hypothetical protein